MKPIYLDHNATTTLLPEVWEAMRPFALEAFGNPASAHQFARKPRRALEDARERVAQLLDAFPDEVIFTSGATEANNLAIFGLCGEPPGTILSSPLEHPSVAEPVRQLANRGFCVEYLAVDEAGHVLMQDVPAPASLTALMLVNHETGAIQPVRELAALLAAKREGGADGARVHCDATQAVGRMPVRFHELGVGSLALSAHKFYGPKGVGALLLRRGSRLMPRTWGGHQQRGMRPGTEAVHLAVGLATALELACRDLDQRRSHVCRLRERFLNGLRAARIEFALNGPTDGGVPHTLNLSFPGLKADALLMALDLAGIACATGSACSSGSLLPSAVLQAMRVPEVRLRSSLRFSLGHLLSDADIDDAVERIAQAVSRQALATPDGFRHDEFPFR